jgi:hypothetical protein
MFLCVNTLWTVTTLRLLRALWQVTVGGHAVTVFEAVEVHISVVVAGPGEGRPAVRVLLTTPPIGEQPGDKECAAAAAAAGDSAGPAGSLATPTVSSSSSSAGSGSKRKADSADAAKGKHR